MIARPCRELLDRWRARADQLAPFAPAAAEAFRMAADELARWEGAADDSVSIKEAHEIGGYSIDHLQRLVASGQLENVSQRGRPRIRRSDVPVKPGHQAALRDDAGTRPLKASAVVASAITRSTR